LSVVGGERDGKDIVGVSNEAAGGSSGGELPEAESLVPGGGESVSTVRGDDLFMFSNCSSTRYCAKTYTVGDDVGVTVKRALWVSVGSLVTGEVPDDEGLVS
jgi:hypothetical protein